MGGGGGLCAECDVTQEGFSEQTLQSVMVEGRWVNKDKIRFEAVWGELNSEKGFQKK